MVPGVMVKQKMRMGGEMMKDQMRNRILKVEEIGDFWRNRTKPRIRLKGKWLANAGIMPNHYVSVENPATGTLIIRLMKEEGI